MPAGIFARSRARPGPTKNSVYPYILGRFAHPPLQKLAKVKLRSLNKPGSAFVPYVGRPIEDVLCVQEDRVVGADNCVSWHRRLLQIPPQRHSHHYVRATVRVHQYPDGRLAIFDGPRCLARFDPGRTDDVVSQVA